MILFWLICAGLVAIALAFVLPTLLHRGARDDAKSESDEANADVYRDQLSELEADRTNGIISAEQYELDRTEIERRLLEDVAATGNGRAGNPKTTNDRAPVYAIAFGLPVVAVVLYLWLGNSAALSGAPNPGSFAGERAGGQMSQQGIEANVAALAKRLEQNPGDAEGWAMLGRSYINLEKYSEASNAYAKATALKTQDVDLLTEYAFAKAMANGRKLDGEPRELIKKALQMDPENPKALQLAGSAEFQAKNYQLAIDYWQKVLEKSTDPDLTRSVTQQIDQAKSLVGTSAK